MKSKLFEIMPVRLLSTLKKLGRDLNVARRKRLLTEAMMAERIGVGRATYQRAERGDPRVAMGVYAMAMFVLGLSDRIGELVDPRSEVEALLFGDDVLPKRVRVSKKPPLL
jgi:DNA-binding XRE family transcriptional regulator